MAEEVICVHLSSYATVEEAIDAATEYGEVVSVTLYRSEQDGRIRGTALMKKENEDGRPRDE